MNTAEATARSRKAGKLVWAAVTVMTKAFADDGVEVDEPTAAAEAAAWLADPACTHDTWDNLARIAQCNPPHSDETREEVISRLKIVAQRRQGSPFADFPQQ